jgi:protein-S-isoprenylcysteine O-methyltransferase Ste14
MLGGYLSPQGCYQWILLLWRALGLVWLVGLFANKPTAQPWNSGLRIAYFLIMWLTLLPLLSDRWHKPVILRPSLATAEIGALLCAVGFFLAIWSRLVLANNWSGSVVIKVDHKLIEEGPYRRIRHPMYTGFLCLFLGTAIAIGSLASFVGFVCFLLVHIWKLRREEALLAGHFPDSYPNYKARTYALVPLIF